MENQFVKIHTYNKNQVALIKGDDGKELLIACRPNDIKPVNITLKYETDSIRDIMFETLTGKAIETLIDNEINNQ